MYTIYTSTNTALHATAGPKWTEPLPSAISTCTVQIGAMHGKLGPEHQRRESDVESPLPFFGMVDVIFLSKYIF